MADNHGSGAHGTDKAAGHPAMDYAEHERTYQLFISLSKWTVIFNVVLLILMAIFLL